ncbi:MAG: hypothetical protein FVQ84_04635 [Planctomycetes bacterium]|nr:hypothetical protein [Planctomycetota bacterium]
MLYIRLFHGRTDPNQDMDECGSNGPVLGPYKYIHTTYKNYFRLAKLNDNCDELFLHEDMLYYNGVYYGDWSMFTEEIFKKGEFATIPFEQSKANLPALEQKH